METIRRNDGRKGVRTVKIDMENGWIIVEDEKGSVVYAMASQEAFSIISQAWLRCGWDVKYVYSFTWMGRPVIQLPEDMIRIQEVIYLVKPDVIIETGIAHGGSLVYYASLCKIMGSGRVIGIDIEIRPQNRKAIEGHELYRYITLIEGDSIDPGIVAKVKSLVNPGEKVLVILDSNHSKKHVLEELESYHGLVSRGSYIIAADGIMASLVGAPRSSNDWSWDNPKNAVKEFALEHPGFILEEQPLRQFNEGEVTKNVTYWPWAWLKRIK